MSDISEKMQYRAFILSILNKYSNVAEIPNEKIDADIVQLKSVSDKDLLAKVLLKEVSEHKTDYANVCAIFLMNTIDKDIFEKHALEALRNKDISDEKKFFIISLLKQKGLQFDYNDLDNYVKNPERLAQDGVKDFLADAINDAEVQIDLLDFYQNIPKEERLSLLYNLAEEFSGDNLANAFSLIIQLDIEDDEADIIINTLSKSESVYAKEGLEFILLNKNIDIKTREIVQNTLKEINSKNIGFKNTSLIENSKIHKCYISFVDGNSNFSFIISRIRSNNIIDCTMVTINILKGITACMGFSKLEIENFNMVLKRLFSDSIPVEINPIALKSILSYYYDKNLKNGYDIPYEFIVWKNLIKDIEKLDYDVSEFINSKLETVNLNETKVRKFTVSKIVENWFYFLNQNKNIDKLIDIIEKKHINNFDEINENIVKVMNDDFLNNKDFSIELQSRLLIQAYVARLAGLKMTSSVAYSLCYKNPYLKILVNSIIDKSLYMYFLQVLHSNNSKNLFKKEIKSVFSKDELENIVNKFEEKWTQKKE